MSIATESPRSGCALCLSRIDSEPPALPHRFPSMQTIHRWLTRVGIATSHPLALAAVIAFVVLWLIFGMAGQ